MIPAWRDSANLSSLLPVLARRDGITEIIVANAGPDAESERVALSCGATFLTCANPNRGEQMNRGAEAASGGVIIFQHSDTQLSDRHVRAITAAFSNPDVIGGAFYRKFDGRHPRLMWLESVARFLTRHGGTLYGDQSIFVRRDVFKKLGGFANIPLMEDVEFSRRLRAAGKILVLDPPVQSSARRHLREGAWRTSIQNGLFILLYNLGVSPHWLHRWYYATAKSEVARDSVLSS